MKTRLNLKRSGRPSVVAMVLGTALTAFGPAAVTRADAPASTTQAISDMSRYCTTCWRNASMPFDNWSDCTQEVFHRMLQRVAPEVWGSVFRDEGSARDEFLRAIDTVKKRWQRSRKFALAPIDGVPDHHEQEERFRQEARQEVAQAAEDLLTPRQQQILRLSFEGWQVQEIARELQLGAERVSDEKYKAIRRLREHLCQDGMEC